MWLRSPPKRLRPGAFSTLPKGSQHIGSMTSSANGAGVLLAVGLEFRRKFQQFVLCGHSVISSIPIDYHSCSSIYSLLALRLGHACKITTSIGTTVRSDEPRWYFRPFSWVESLRNHPYIGHWGMLTWPVSDSWRDVEGIAIRYPLSLWHNGAEWPIIACNSLWVSALKSFCTARILFLWNFAPTRAPFATADSLAKDCRVRRVAMEADVDRQKEPNADRGNQWFGTAAL